MRRFDAVLGMQKQQRPPPAPLDQIDAGAFDDKRARPTVGPLQHFLARTF
jgi:hypothetical protein